MTTTSSVGTDYGKFTIKKLESIVGTLSRPSKMPCHGYSLPAKRCQTGKKLHQVEDSVCFDCYALKGRYLFSTVQRALDYRYDALIRNPHLWELALTELIRRKEHSGYFRWHDSGDLQGVYHLRHINNIAYALPDIKFWLPTRETRIVTEFQKHSTVAPNLIIRISSFFKSQRPNTNFKLTSTVDWSTSHENCSAPQTNGMCDSCRRCWDANIPNINYALH